MPNSGFTEDLPVSAPSAVMPNTVPTLAEKTSTHPEGKFFSHPEDFPLEVRTSLTWPEWPVQDRSAPPIGLRFFSGTRLRLQAGIRITIPIRQREHHFQARVSEVRALRVGYEITAVLRNTRDAEHLALVERICAMECVLHKPVFRQAG
jgi:hypothetical protein